MEGLESDPNSDVAVEDLKDIHIYSKDVPW